MKIIQIINVEKALYALGDDGIVYRRDWANKAWVDIDDDV